MREKYDISPTRTAMEVFVDMSNSNIGVTADDHYYDGMGSGMYLIGKRTFQWDDQGFVHLERYTTSDVARAVFDSFVSMCEEDVLEDDTEEPSATECVIHHGRHHLTGSYACEILSQENYYGTD